MKLTEENYFSKEANQKYISNSQYHDFVGTLGIRGCEARAMEKIKGEWEDDENKECYLVGSYIDAHFSGTLDVFIAQKNEFIYSKRGTKYAPFKKADEMIARIERDPLLVKTLSGGMQQIMTGNLFSADWKIKIDSYHPGKAIIDLKTTKSIKNGNFVKDYGYVSFVEYYGYIDQMAIYQKIVELNTGEKLPVLIPAVSKEKTIDIALIGIDQKALDEALMNIEVNIPRILKLKNGEEKPIRCETCDYCLETKVLKEPIHYSQIINSI